MKKITQFLLSFIIIIFITICIGCTKEGSKCNHEYSNWTIDIEPDCVNNGIKSHICKKCGDIESQSVPALKHNFVNGTCTICGIHNKNS